MEFYLYPGCEYLYEGTLCYYLEPIVDTSNSSDNVWIKIKSDNSSQIVERTHLTPIELTIGYLDQHMNNSSLNLGNGIKTWIFNNDVPPYKILYNGKYFIYTDSKFEENGVASVPISYISDIQAIRSVYIS